MRIFRLNLDGYADVKMGLPLDARRLKKIHIEEILLLGAQLFAGEVISGTGHSGRNKVSKCANQNRGTVILDFQNLGFKRAMYSKKGELERGGQKFGLASRSSTLCTSMTKL